MPCFDAEVNANDCGEPSAEPVGNGGRAFEALAQTALASRFFSWAGGAGQSYVFSIYPPGACPAFCDAILLAVARDDRGSRRILWAGDTGAFPEPVVARAERRLAARTDALELHMHLLARSSSERRAVLADLGAAFDALVRPDA